VRIAAKNPARTCNGDRQILRGDGRNAPQDDGGPRRAATLLL